MANTTYPPFHIKEQWVQLSFLCAIQGQISEIILKWYYGETENIRKHVGTSSPSLNPEKLASTQQCVVWYKYSTRSKPLLVYMYVCIGAMMLSYWFDYIDVSHKKATSLFSFLSWDGWCTHRCHHWLSLWHNLHQALELGLAVIAGQVLQWLTPGHWEALIPDKTPDLLQC